MAESKNNKSVIYRCDGVKCRKKKGKLLDYYIKKYKNLYYSVKVVFQNS